MKPNTVKLSAKGNWPPFALIVETSDYEEIASLADYWDNVVMKQRRIPILHSNVKICQMTSTRPLWWVVCSQLWDMSKLVASFVIAALIFSHLQ